MSHRKESFRSLLVSHLPWNSPSMRQLATRNQALNEWCCHLSKDISLSFKNWNLILHSLLAVHNIPQVFSSSSVICFRSHQSCLFHISSQMPSNSILAYVTYFSLFHFFVLVLLCCRSHFLESKGKRNSFKYNQKDLKKIEIAGKYPVFLCQI